MQGGLHLQNNYKTHCDKTPLVTIVTPNYNGATYLEETILCIRNQSYKNIEHIIVDGGSTDQSLEILKNNEDKIDFFISEKDNGMYDAINKGFSYANGKILAYLNSDDLYHEKCIEKVVNAYQSLDEDYLLFSDFIIKNETTKNSYPYKSTNLGKDSILCYERMPFAQQSAFWTKKIWDSIGPFDTKYRYVGDFDFFSRILLAPFSKIYRLKKHLATFRIHEDALSTHQKMIDEAVIVRERLDLKHISFRTLRKKLSHYYYTLSNIKSSLTYRYDKTKLPKEQNHES
ncbi:MAG: glycosyltransferase [Candidatus Cloacimonetes bacterium]|nr:glycosyltransferase [Candidatus Cloacimonadota bacterium]